MAPLCSEKLTEKEYCYGRNTSSKPCVVTLSEKDIKSDRLLFRLVPSERPTGETACGLWQEEPKTITTSSGAKILVDSEDFPFLNQWKWKINRSGYAYRTIRSKEDGKRWKSILMHRLICCPKGKEEVDHINRNKLDNRKQNLRIVAHWVNSHNREKGTGVKKPKGRNKWYAQIYVNGERKFLGCFDTKEEAMAARIAAEHRLLPTVQTQGLKRCNAEGKTEFVPLELLPSPVASDATTGAIIGECDRFVTTGNGTLRKVNRNGTNGSVGLARMVQLLPTPNAAEGEKYTTRYNPEAKWAKGLRQWL